MVNPVWLKTFITLIEQGHFTRTAEVLAMTQPGVSQHIKKLEEYYQTSLINRFGKQFELTPSGETVYRFAQSLIESEVQLRESLIKDHPYSGICRISSPGALGLNIYPRLIELQKQYPELSIHYEVAPNHRIEEELLNNHIDCGLMTRKPKQESVLSAHEVSSEQLCLVVPATFSFTGYSSLRKLGLIGHPDASHHVSLMFQENFPEEFRGIGSFPDHGYVNQINQILEPVASGLGFTVLPVSVVQSFSRPELLKMVELPCTVDETVFLVTKTHKPLASRYSFLFETLFSTPFRG
ncbi:LysR family transcriptional regulator [Endozoicomonas sp. OPT23]|uniref:LysR family transcriptional regulator n=1 Tax=Endozoicomonas sp. OPT23 TaxID=2072845 RepID=UPI00129B40BE|nr:LysR family transcriptional regulator [Endozoicomonas sp. OPT23]MRI32618.1 LysR family transcriptional regulator [Endozoicomonas sp. OPT23]